MQAHNFAKQYGGSTTIDLCFDCRAIWFDRWESLSLAPEAVLDLFKLTNARLESLQAYAGVQVAQAEIERAQAGYPLGN